MRSGNLLIAVLGLLSVYGIQSCKKSNDTGSNPIPVVKPDTLASGWTKQVLSEGTGFSDIFFNSATTGYAVGSKIYKTTDGGATWNAVFNNSTTYNIFMTADNKAFFVSNDSSAIYKTTDGGNNFSGNKLADKPTDIYFTDNNNGFCITYNGLYYTTDGGLTWPKKSTTGLPTFGAYSSLFCFNATTLWVVSSTGGIYRSTGTLDNWQAATISGGSGFGGFNSVYATSATTVYAVNRNGEVYKSINGGVTFLFNRQLDISAYADIHFINDQLGYVSGGRFVYKTTDAGANWSKVVSMGEGTLGELHFTDANHGWVSGNYTNGFILNFR